MLSSDISTFSNAGEEEGEDEEEREDEEESEQEASESEDELSEADDHVRDMEATETERAIAERKRKKRGNDDEVQSPIRHHTISPQLSCLPYRAG